MRSQPRTVYVVVDRVTEATILWATGFIPFVYFVHEKAREYLAGDSATETAPGRAVALLPAPGLSHSAKLLIYLESDVPLPSERQHSFEGSSVCRGLQ